MEFHQRGEGLRRRREDCAQRQRDQGKCPRLPSSLLHISLHSSNDRGPVADAALGIAGAVGVIRIGYAELDGRGESCRHRESDWSSLSIVQWALAQPVVAREKVCALAAAATSIMASNVAGGGIRSVIPVDINWCRDARQGALNFVRSTRLLPADLTPLADYHSQRSVRHQVLPMKKRVRVFP